MKAVATERDRIRARERERLAKARRKGSLRPEAKAFMTQIVERLQPVEVARHRARPSSSSPWRASAGRRPRSPSCSSASSPPIALFLLARLLHLRDRRPRLAVIAQDRRLLVGAPISASRRRKSPCRTRSPSGRSRSRRAFPDTLDLLLICVESGMSIEHAFRKVEPGDRRPVDPDGGGADADDGRAVLPARPAHGLRELRARAPGSRSSSRSSPC